MYCPPRAPQATLAIVALVASVRAAVLIRRLLHGLIVFAVIGCARGASAQAEFNGPDPSQIRVRIGPLLMNPTLSLTNIGVDRNVFNEPPEKDPKQDFTLSVAPNTDLWLPLGGTWLIGEIKEQVNWYQKYASERNANSTFGLRWALPLNRLELHTNVRYVSARDRPGYEIDARSARTEVTYGGTAELRALSSTFVGVTYVEAGTKFDSTATFLNMNLHDELSRESTTRGLVVRHQLTPLTAIIINASRVAERFDYSSLRDSDSNQISATVNFDPLALIKGSATFGYRDFKPLSNLPSYQGATASVNLSYAMLGMTRFAIGAIRDVQYSYDETQPYYLQTGVQGSVAQQIFGPFDVVARAGWQSLAYRDRPDAQIDVRDRTDEVHSYGAGAGFHMGKDLRLGFNVDHSSRTSKVALRQYQNLTFGSQITYGVP